MDEEQQQQEEREVRAFLERNSTNAGIKKKDRPGCMAMGLMVIATFLMTVFMFVLLIQMTGLSGTQPIWQILTFVGCLLFSSWFVSWAWLLEERKRRGENWTSIFMNTLVLAGVIVGVCTVGVALLSALCSSMLRF